MLDVLSEVLIVGSIEFIHKVMSSQSLPLVASSLIVRYDYKAEAINNLGHDGESFNYTVFGLETHWLS